MSKSIKSGFFCIVLLLIVGLAQAISGTEAISVASEKRILIEGTVVETINTGGYSYICVESNGQLNWAAIRGSMIAVGEEVEINSGSLMTDFISESLGRTFDTIIFTNKIVRH